MTQLALKKQIAKTIKRLMKEKGVDQMTVRRTLDFNRETFRTWLDAEKLITIDRLMALADYFQVDVTTFLYPETELPQQKEPTDLQLIAGYRRFLQDQDLPEDTIQLMVASLQFSLWYFKKECTSIA